MLAALALAPVLQAPAAGEAESGDSSSDGFQPIFNGDNLEGWSGDPDLWRVENGAIVGQTTQQHTVEDSNFIIWQGGQPGNFILELEFKIVSGNSGVQYRAFEMEGRYRLGGYQADIDEAMNYAGACYGEQFGGMLAERGQVVALNDDREPTQLDTLGSSTALARAIDNDGWNTYRITAQGHTMMQQINGHVMSVVIDQDSDGRRMKGRIGFQLHPGPPMKVMFRNVRLKRLPAADGE